MLDAARAIVVAAAALIAPFSGGWTPVQKWVEPCHYDTRTDTLHFEQYWVFESDYDTDLRCWTYRQRQISLWEFLATEIPPRVENEDEEP